MQFQKKPPSKLDEFDRPLVKQRPAAVPTDRSHELLFHHRHFRRDLHDRLLIYAFHWHSTIEDVINHAIAHGLDNFDTHIIEDQNWRPHLGAQGDT